MKCLGKGIISFSCISGKRWDTELLSRVCTGAPHQRSARGGLRRSWSGAPLQSRPPIPPHLNPRELLLAPPTILPPNWQQATSSCKKKVTRDEGNAAKRKQELTCLYSTAGRPPRSCETRRRSSSSHRSVLVPK